MARPQTLADVARHARERKADFALALDEFVDEFYLDHPDKAAQQRRLEDEGTALTLTGVPHLPHLDTPWP